MQSTFPQMARWACGALLFASLSAVAAESPAKLAGVTVVNAAEVQKLMAAGVPVIDTRVANEYAVSHIKGAKNVPYKEKSAKAENFDSSVDSFDLSKLPSAKGSPLIFYCNAGECWKSYKASVMASRAGYTAIQWYRDGIPDWTSKGLPVE